MKEQIKIFETHAHYDDKQYEEDRDSILDILHRNGIDKIVNISYDKASILKSVELAKKYDFIYAAIGYHPCDCNKMESTSIEDMFEICKKENKIVAIGEIGLDYYWDDVDRSVQKKCFIEQINLANRLNLPIVIHSRDAAKDTYDILKNNKSKGVMHCYSYSVEMAKEFVKLGYYLGVGGVLTFKNAKHIKDVVKEIDIEKIIVETDSPYLTPEPFRGKRNSSIYLTYVIDKIAEIKGMSRDEVAKVTYQNAMKMYGL